MAYESSLENVDSYICGCGCNSRLSFVHGQLQRHIIDIKQKLKSRGK